MDAVIAGWMAGYVMALLSTAALTYLAVRAADLGAIGRWLGEGASPALLAVPASLGTAMFWTFAGLLIGVAYDVGGMEDEPGVLGAPSAAFVVGMAAVAVLPLPVLLLLWPRRWWLWGSMSAAFLGLFGWLTPILAER